jgi:hypothetical protein
VRVGGNGCDDFLELYVSGEEGGCKGCEGLVELNV